MNSFGRVLPKAEAQTAPGRCPLKRGGLPYKQALEPACIQPIFTLVVLGATGLLSSLVAKQHSHIKCMSFDLPIVAPIAKKWIEKENLSDRINVVSGDFLKDALPKSDIITMGNILHDWNLEKKKHLIRLAYEALPENGAFVVIENIIDDDRRENAFGLMMSLHMLIEFGDAFDFTGADFWGWCQEAGFKRYEVVHLVGPCSAAIAYK